VTIFCKDQNVMLYLLLNLLYDLKLIFINNMQIKCCYIVGR